MKARSAADRSREAANKTTGDVLPRGGDKKSEDARSIGNLPIDGSQSARAESAGISRRQQRKLDALANKAPAKLAEVQRGEKSVHRACIEAGIVRVPTPLDLLRRAWARASGPERAVGSLLGIARLEECASGVTLSACQDQHEKV